ncbi:MOSC domain-containing protein [Aquimarina sp. ERC-38]|uniref:MOSC domain-containing protein n=1 Tax=Aquimarina sp. ERC-38 TaxID=2949996 RepID=UPI0022473C66|nr:MOSC domain-containing protein [Aquimarina sp. ERC-38]UZO80220.1 MOSC domain-containing protein [Aquimarina sp. ERC-38]
MKVKSVNIGSPTTVSWKAKEVTTGIYKYPVDKEIYLDKEDVAGDSVIDRRYHGGVDKACYLYSADHYAYWQGLYPYLEWNYGMFGENITLEGLKEENLFLGDIYQLGQAKVQITQPREPCFKLGIRFGTQKVLKQFLNKTFCGSYLKVIEPGAVIKGDTMQLLEGGNSPLSIAELYKLFFFPEVLKEDLENALGETLLTGHNRENLQNRLKILT